jgi:hypothetical protein
MLDIPSISAVVVAFGVIIGIVFAVLELRNITKTRQMELIMNIYSRFGTREYIDAWEKIRTRESKDYDEYIKKHGWADVMQVSSAFEGLGLLVHRKFLDIDLAHELLSESTKMTWEKVKPMIEDARKQLTQRKFGEYIPIYQSWEYLYNEMQKREQRLQAQQ